MKKKNNHRRDNSKAWVWVYLSRLICAALGCLVFASVSRAQTMVPGTAPGSSYRDWVRVGPVRPGTLILLAASGQVDVGGGRGAFRPEGTTSFANEPGYPALTRTRYGLIARLTSSPADPNDEVREEWAYADTTAYCSARGGHLWLAVNDNVPADNTGSFAVTIRFSTCEAENPARLFTRVRVVNESGTPVEGAEIYRDGALLGVTDREGFGNFPRLATGARLIARKRVFENRTYLNSHSVGSTQNWNFRVYNTSLRVNNDSTVSPFVVTHPANVQILHLSRSNTLIGLHVLASLEWDASAAELANIRDKLIQASQRLYNATDGQFFIEQVELLDNATQWDDTDYRVFADVTLRANAFRNNFHWAGVGGNTHMNMARDNSEYVWAHEFGHYGFDLGDEYADGTSTSCTINVTTPSSPFANGQARASCMMWNAASKLCSNHPDNPHVRTTNQGSVDCWTHLVGKFSDRETSPRWTLQSPNSRGVIVGMLPAIPVRDWITRATVLNRDNQDLCEPIEMIVTRTDNDQPIAGVEVYNRTHYGQEIFQGRSRGDDPTTAENETGQITVTGAHLGDRVRTNQGGAVTISGCLLSTGLKHHVALAAFQRQALKINPDPFELYISVEPGPTDEEVQVRVQASTRLKSPPQVEFILSGTTKTQSTTMEFDSSTGTYTGWLDRLPLSLRANIQVTAIDTEGQAVTRIRNVTMSPIDPKNQQDVFSDNGQLVVVVPAGGLPERTRISIGPADVAPPTLPQGFEVISGPYKVVASTQNQMNQSGVVRFQLPNIARTNKTGNYNGVEIYDPKTLEIRRFKTETGEWENVGGTLLSEVAIVTLRTKDLGTYALVGRKLSGAPAPLGTGTDRLGPTVSASLTASPETYNGPCPATIKFAGQIMLKSKGTVKYRFIRSDGATGPVEALTFDSPGTKYVTTTWTLGGAELPFYEGWQAIKVESPDIVVSEKARFTVRCPNH